MLRRESVTRRLKGAKNSNKRWEKSRRKKKRRNSRRIQNTNKQLVPLRRLRRLLLSPNLRSNKVWISRRAISKLVSKLERKRLSSKEAVLWMTMSLDVRHNPPKIPCSANEASPTLLNLTLTHLTTTSRMLEALTGETHSDSSLCRLGISSQVAISKALSLSWMILSAMT